MKVSFSTKNLVNLYSLCVDIFEFETTLEENCLMCKIEENVFVFNESPIIDMSSSPSIVISIDYKHLDYDEVCNRLQLYCYRTKQFLKDIGINLCLDKKIIEWAITPFIQIVIQINPQQFDTNQSFLTSPLNENQT